MESIPLKESLFCELHCLQVVGVLLVEVFFNFWFSSQQHATQYAKKDFQTQGLWKHRENKKESMRQRADSVCSLVRQKRGSGHKTTFHHGFEKVLKRHLMQHMVNEKENLTVCCMCTQGKPQKSLWIELFYCGNDVDHPVCHHNW